MSQLVRPASPRKPIQPNEFLSSGALNVRYDKQLIQYRKNLIKYEQALCVYSLALQSYHLKLVQEQNENDDARLNQLARQERDIEVKLRRTQKQLVEEMNFDPESFYSPTSN